MRSRRRDVAGPYHDDPAAVAAAAAAARATIATTSDDVILAGRTPQTARQETRDAKSLATIDRKTWHRATEACEKSKVPVGMRCVLSQGVGRAPDFSVAPNDNDRLHHRRQHSTRTIGNCRYHRSSSSIVSSHWEDVLCDGHHQQQQQQ